MPFKKGQARAFTPVGRDLPQIPRGEFCERSKIYERIGKISLPKTIAWEPWRVAVGKRVSIAYSTPAKQYKMARDNYTGDVVYYRRKGDYDAKVNKDAVDTEPQPPRAQYRVGGFGWFIGFNQLWYLVTVVSRERNKMTIRPVGKLDADKIDGWPYEPTLTFTAKRNNVYYTRLRPLKARKP